MYGVFENEKSATFFQWESQRLVGVAPAPGAQLIAIQPHQTLAQPGAGGDAMRTAVCFKAHRFDSIARNPRTENEHRPLRDAASRATDNALARLEVPAIARVLEVVDDG